MVSSRIESIFYQSLQLP